MEKVEWQWSIRSESDEMVDTEVQENLDQLKEAINEIIEMINGGRSKKMSELKTLQEIIAEQSGGTRTYPMIKDGKIPNTDDKIYLDAVRIAEKRLRKEAKKWIKALNKTSERACKKQAGGCYNDAELEIEGVTYTASAFADDETKPIIRFINQFFGLEEPEEEWERESHEQKRRIRELLEAKK
jgi:hypothetical protein